MILDSFIDHAAFEHNYPFDPSHGYNLDRLLALVPPDAPTGLDEFWQDTYRSALEIPLNLSMRDVSDQFVFEGRVFEVEYDSWDDVRIGGWLTVPAQPVTRGVVFGHGYGGRDTLDLNPPGPPAIVLFPCLRGMGRSTTPLIPEPSEYHVVNGIESRDTYVLRGCVADTWRAASVLLNIAPQVEGCLDYIGGSFGGGIGAMALAWDLRFRKAFLSVPTFGNHPIRVSIPCTGSGNAVRERYLADPAVLDVLAFYDAAIMASRVDTPVFCECALFDPAVPPPGQFTVYNALRGPKRLFAAAAGHFDYAGSSGKDIKLRAALDEWFAC